MSSTLGKMVLLLSSKAKQVYAGEISSYIQQKLIAQEATIKAQLGVAPRGYILVTDTHSSKSDPEPHYTVDAYVKDTEGFDEPIGCIHMYENGNVKVYNQPRTKAYKAYKAKAN